MPTLKEIAGQIRAEAAIADRPGQLVRLETLADWIDEWATVLEETESIAVAAAPVIHGACGHMFPLDECVADICLVAAHGAADAIAFLKAPTHKEAMDMFRDGSPLRRSLEAQ